MWFPVYVLGGGVGALLCAWLACMNATNSFHAGIRRKEKSISDRKDEVMCYILDKYWMVSKKFSKIILKILFELY